MNKSPIRYVIVQCHKSEVRAIKSAIHKAGGRGASSLTKEQLTEASLNEVESAKKESAPFNPRFVLTHKLDDGTRRLIFGNQGRHHFDSRDEAQTLLDKLKPDLRNRLNFKECEVLEVDCYPSGDAKATVF